MVWPNLVRRGTTWHRSKPPCQFHQEAAQALPDQGKGTWQGGSGQDDQIESEWVSLVVQTIRFAQNPFPAIAGWGGSGHSFRNA